MFGQSDVKMHPTGIEPALKASEAFVLSVRLRVHVLVRNYQDLIRKTAANAANVLYLHGSESLHIITKLLHHLEYIITSLSDCLVNKVHLPFYYKKRQNLPVLLPLPPGCD